METPTPRQRAHRAFFEASVAGAFGGPWCWRRELTFGGHADAPDCDVLCNCVTNAIAEEQAATGRAAIEAVRAILSRSANDRQRKGL